jgi:hypothetical protein
LIAAVFAAASAGNGAGKMYLAVEAGTDVRSSRATVRTALEHGDSFHAPHEQAGRQCYLARFSLSWNCAEWERPLDGTRPQVGVECSKGDVEIRRSEKNARRAVVAINVAGFLDIPA